MRTSSRSSPRSISYGIQSFLRVQIGMASWKALNPRRPTFMWVSQQPDERRHRLVVVDDRVEPARADLPLPEAGPDRVDREPVVVLDAREALLLGGGHEHAVADERRGAVVVEGADAEDVHRRRSAASRRSWGRRCRKSAPATTAAPRSFVWTKSNMIGCRTPSRPSRDVHHATREPGPRGRVGLRPRAGVGQERPARGLLALDERLAVEERLPEAHRREAVAGREAPGGPDALRVHARGVPAHLDRGAALVDRPRGRHRLGDRLVLRRGAPQATLDPAERAGVRPGAGQLAQPGARGLGGGRASVGSEPDAGGRTPSAPGARARRGARSGTGRRARWPRRRTPRGRGRGRRRPARRARCSPASCCRPSGRSSRPGSGCRRPRPAARPRTGSCGRRAGRARTSWSRRRSRRRPGGRGHARPARRSGGRRR